MRLRRRPLHAVALGALLLVVSPAAAAPHSYTVVIDKMKFGPVPTGLHAGDSITWVNRDFLKHSATAADHSFDVDLPAGAKATTTLKKSGAIPFSCRYHPGMRGVLQVK
ncbi:MAG TPA: cupredoxin domain-containing protein [Sphingomicrobium sp.]|jgi:plastocyanin|nr:cupredoxin domain-containing protein [Sphingomicrobium sp.]